MDDRYVIVTALRREYKDLRCKCIRRRGGYETDI